MTEESAVNYWEVRSLTNSSCFLRKTEIYIFQKYGHVAFDTAQKAVLTSCVLRYKPSPAPLSLFAPTSPMTTASSIATTVPASPTGKKFNKPRPTPGPLEEGLISCCFSFTIQRDLHGIPTLIAGMSAFISLRNTAVSKGHAAYACSNLSSNLIDILMALLS